MYQSILQLESLKCKKLHPDAILPTRATEYDAGYDLYALEGGEILPNRHAIIPTGISIRMPTLPHPFKVYGSIRSRSGLSAKQNLEVGAGVIDFSYKCAIGVILYNHNQSCMTTLNDGKGNFIEQIEVGKTFKYSKGDRIAQLVLEVHITPDVEEVDEFEDLENDGRNGGFGSTGL